MLGPDRELSLRTAMRMGLLLACGLESEERAQTPSHLAP